MALTTQVNKASPNSFELVFPIVPEGVNLTSNRELTLNIFSTIIPGVTLGTEENRWQGTITTYAAGVLEFEQWSTEFIVDEEFKNWSVLYKWLQYINNNKDQMMQDNRAYTVDAFLRVVDNFQEEIFKLQFINVWINNLGEITLSHREGENVLECNALFVYDRFEIRD